ncbi:hypothetical protein JOB18_013986, partial [Solea senegalensis]
TLAKVKTTTPTQTNTHTGDGGESVSSTGRFFLVGSRRARLPPRKKPFPFQ